MKDFFRWLGTPFRAMNAWFPFQQAGRATLVYIAFVCSGPALVLTLIWSLTQIRDFKDAPAIEKLHAFSEIAMIMAWGLFLILLAFSAFVSIRAIKFNAKQGTFDMESQDVVSVNVVNPPSEPIPVDPNP